MCKDAGWTGTVVHHRSERSSSRKRVDYRGNAIQSKFETFKKKNGRSTIKRALQEPSMGLARVWGNKLGNLGDLGV